MCKKTNSDLNGTSFQDVTFKASVNDLIKAFGEPDYEDNTGKDKTNFEWDMETDNGDVFSIYDWKEYRKLNKDKQIEWHIGSHSRSISDQAKSEILIKILN
jgi:hypothetical protein